ncbi:MAG: hypothetical protein JO063_13900 [Pseudonocardiales bacterium]|nr:hypothetical protein [Pseudonocardiales bacterium]MBV9029181.1 hypothetical protein [Pseudonocardiales bacterium]MBW0011181.1 hypothetical protein [Pseudonocardiales bacterium]
MRALRSFLAFGYDFLVGDDWTIAAGVMLALALTKALTVTGIPAWWLPPLAVLGMLAFSLGRAIRRSR